MNKKFFFFFLIMGFVGTAAAKPLSVQIDEFFGADYKPLNATEVSATSGKIKTGSGGFSFALTDTDYVFPGKQVGFESSYTLDAFSECTNSYYTAWVEGPNAGYDKTAKTVYIDSCTQSTKVNFKLPRKEGTFDYTFKIGQPQATFNPWERSVESDSVTINVKDIKASLSLSKTNTVKGESVWIDVDGQGYMGLETSKLYVNGEIVKSSDGPFSYKTEFSSTGSKEIKAVVTDSLGRKDTITKTITVKQIPEPNAEISGPSQVKAGEQMSFSAGRSTAYGDISYTWSIDGEYAGSGKEFSTVFQKSGEHRVKVVIEGSKGKTDSVSKVVKVTVSGPTAKMNYNKDKMYNVGETISLSAEPSKKGTLSITDYTWEINGNTLNGQVVDYTFKERGNREIKLTVADGNGNSDTVTNTVRVAESKNNNSGVNKDNNSDSTGNQDSGKIQNFLTWLINLFTIG